MSACYNALGHLESILRPVFKEMFRVTKQDGYLMFIATWKMDMAALNKIKNVVSEYSNLALLTEINNSKYSTLVIKKSI